MELRCYLCGSQRSFSPNISNFTVYSFDMDVSAGGPKGAWVEPEQYMTIINTYFVTEESKAYLYETITPVNSFRIIFNQYFGADYPLLEDVSYYNFTKEELEDNPLIIKGPCWGEE